MKSKNKKGFTLVELLAVIVILAVVILIAVTAVVPRMNSAKEKAFVDEAMMYMKAAKEAYISNENIECYNVSDMSELIKQNKSGYSGTVYVNEKGVSLNLTNGKYYIKTDTQPNAYDLVTTKPEKFIDTCSDTNTTYTISYDLDGGTVANANPTSYNSNTSTITLNNPTKSGYRFVGWSSKNLFDEEKITSLRNVTKSNKIFIFDATDTADNDSNAFIIRKYMSSNINNHENICIIYQSKRIECAFTTGSFDKILLKVNSSKKDAEIRYDSSNLSTTDTYVLSGQLGDYDQPKAYATLKYFQIESGSTATDYQEYMEPTTTAKIYRGSTGNKKFIANWEAI